MGQSILDNHTKKVNKILLIIFGAYGLFFIMLNLIKQDFVNLVSLPSLLSTVVMVTGALSYKNNKGNKYIGLLVSISILLNILAIIKNAPPEQRAGMQLTQIIPLLAMTIYFNRRKFAIFAVIFDIAIIFSQIMSGKIIVMSIASTNLIICLLYFITRWGEEMIVKSSENEQRACSLVEKMENTISTINNSTSVLNTTVVNCTNYLETILESSNAVVAAVEDVTESLNVQVDSITNITDIMIKADDQVNQTSEISQKLSEVSVSAKDIIDEGVDC